MMKNRKLIFFLLIIFLIVYQQLSRSIGRDTVWDNLTKHIPISIKIAISEILFKNKLQTVQIEKLWEENKKIKEELIINKRRNLALKFKLKEPLEITYLGNEKFQIFEKKFEVKKYQTQYNIPKILGKGTAYLAIDNKDIFIVGASGLISYISKNHLLSSENVNKSIVPIKTNLPNIIVDERFFSKSIYGIKGALIFKDKIYISYTKELFKDCYNTSLLVADLNKDYLVFNEFFTVNECIKQKNAYGKFNAAQSGGKILSFDENNILLSVGEYRFRDHAQNKSNYFGKIIKINLVSKVYEILSMGHRNVHGMYYDEDKNKIFSVEHGPDGGDEININDLSKGEIKNFGWPISSYGEHYGGKESEANKTQYKIAPFYKNHEKYGFQEPAYYFLPSLGPSSLTKIPNKYFDNNKSNQDYIVVGTLGWMNRKGEKSIHFFKFDDNNFAKKEFFELNDRVRDIIFDADKELFYFWTDTTSTLNVLKKIQ